MTPVVAPIDAADKELIFSTLPLDAALDTTVVTPRAPFPPVVTAIPAWKVVTPVIVATFTIFGATLPTIPLLFIYQPKTIDNAIALPGDVLLLNSVAISVEPPPTCN